MMPEELAVRPGGAASAAFHLVHIAGSIDRLLTYARGEALNETQRAAALAEEGAAVRTVATGLEEKRYVEAVVGEREVVVVRP